MYKDYELQIQVERATFHNITIAMHTIKTFQYVTLIFQLQDRRLNFIYDILFCNSQFQDITLPIWRHFMRSSLAVSPKFVISLLRMSPCPQWWLSTFPNKWFPYWVFYLSGNTVYTIILFFSESLANYSVLLSLWVMPLHHTLALREKLDIGKRFSFTM